MSEEPTLFDASSIVALVRDLGGSAPLILSEGSTLSLAFYEVGNAIWKECQLHNRLGAQEGEDLLKDMIAIIGAMDVVTIDEEESASSVLGLALSLSLTYYDSCYLAEATESGRMLVSDDSKLLEAAESVGVEAMNTEAFEKRRNWPRT